MSELGTVNNNNRHSHINVHTQQDTQSPPLNNNEIPHKYKDVLEGLGKHPTSERSNQCNRRHNASLSHYTKKSKRN